MRNISLLIKKEFLQILRNKQLLPMMTILPLFQIILLSNAASYDIKKLNLAIWDMNQSNMSFKLKEKFTGSGFFNVKHQINSQKQADNLLINDDVDMILVIPDNFEKELVSNNNSSIQFQINALNNTKASITNNYARSILREFIGPSNADLKIKTESNDTSQIIPITNFWYNTTLDYKTIMVPGIVAEIMTFIIILLCALNIVKEKEIGTIEQLNVTPIKKHEFIIGKLVPFWIIGHFIFWMGLIMGKLIFDIPFVGNPLLLELFLSIFLLVPLGFGLLISTIVDTQQQALFISFFFIIIFILMCGLFTPTETMPKWAQIINIINPIKYIVEINRMVLLKGTGLNVIFPYCIGMLSYGVLIIGLAVKMYKKTNE